MERPPAPLCPNGTAPGAAAAGAPDAVRELAGLVATEDTPWTPGSRRVADCIRCADLLVAARPGDPEHALAPGTFHRAFAVCRDPGCHQVLSLVAVEAWAKADNLQGACPFAQVDLRGEANPCCMPAHDMRQGLARSLLGAQGRAVPALVLGPDSEGQPDWGVALPCDGRTRTLWELPPHCRTVAYLMAQATHAGGGCLAQLAGDSRRQLVDLDLDRRPVRELAPWTYPAIQPCPSEGTIQVPRTELEDLDRLLREEHRKGTHPCTVVGEREHVSVRLEPTLPRLLEARAIRGLPGLVQAGLRLWFAALPVLPAPCEAH